MSIEEVIKEMESCLYDNFQCHCGQILYFNLDLEGWIARLKEKET